jgi:mono/diheme cytochrome c family protein
MRRLALFVPLLVICAGCLDGKQTAARPNKVVGTVAVKQAIPDSDPGKQVFTGSKASCFSCHTLHDAGATGNVGPNLDLAKPEKSLILDRVTHGKSPMPAFKGKLSDQEIKDVVDYVYAATHT